jgi:DNA polymerase elongation subunit (family B)
MRILTLDIETSPHEVYAFNVWQQNIAANQIIAPTAMLTWAAKWKGERKIQFREWADEDFHETLHHMLNEADLIVGYNQDKFDIPHINREFVERGFHPTRPVPTVDLLTQVIRKRFKFPHNRLDYVAQRILGETKLETGGPAFMRGDPKAIKLMERYNKKDVRLTEQLYVKLLPWIKNHPYVGGSDIIILDDDIRYECPACGGTNTRKERPRRTRCFGTNTRKERPRRTRCFAIRLVYCNDCGSWSDGKRKKLQ